MTELDIRPDVVAMLCTIVPIGPTDTWKHDDGTPVTPDEVELVLSMNWRELEAARDYSARAADYEREQAAAVERIQQLAAPYFAKLPKGARMGAVTQLMTADERAELMALMERAAPDGSFLIPRDQD